MNHVVSKEVSLVVPYTLAASCSTPSSFSRSIRDIVTVTKPLTLIQEEVVLFSTL